MSAITSSIIQRKAGQASHYTEAGAREGGTTGHSAVEGGLRGHSIGETWPYRVVHLGGGGAELYRGSVLVKTYAPLPFFPGMLEPRESAARDARYFKWAEDPGNTLSELHAKHLPRAIAQQRAANALYREQTYNHINHPGAC